MLALRHARLRPVPVRTPRRCLSATAPRRAQYTRFGEGDPRRPWQWDTQTKVYAALAAAAGAYYVAHLEQVPETGRWRFMDISPRYESALAKAASEQLHREFRGKILPPTHPLTRHVHRVVTRILDANNLGVLKTSVAPSHRRFVPAAVAAAATATDVWDPDAESAERRQGVVPEAGGKEWELMVVNDDKIVNAMASYGNIVVFTGILPVARDEQGLAAILGHEIGHVVARHASERYSSAKILIAFVALLQAVGLDLGLARMLTTFLLELPNSRTQELEADTIGLRLSARACYDPRAAPEMFERMEKLEQAKGRLNVDFLYTHPTSSTRVKRLEGMLPEAYAIQAASPECAAITDKDSSLSAFRDAFREAFAGERGQGHLPQETREAGGAGGTGGVEVWA